MLFRSSYSNDQENKKFQEIIYKNNVFLRFSNGLVILCSKNEWCPCLRTLSFCLLRQPVHEVYGLRVISIKTWGAFPFPDKNVKIME